MCACNIVDGDVDARNVRDDLEGGVFTAGARKPALVRTTGWAVGLFVV
jgi:hypothetical protein